MLRDGYVENGEGGTEREEEGERTRQWSWWTKARLTGSGREGGRRMPSPSICVERKIY